jgi:hypothetical protein
LNTSRLLGSATLALLVVSGAVAATAAEAETPVRLPIPPVLAVQKRLPPAPAGVTDLKFSDLFTLPVGPKGLEATQKLLALDGKPVRMVGYMAKREVPVAGSFVLVPVPVNLGDEDESLSDDLPPNAVFVHLGLKPAGGEVTVPYVPGLIKVSGKLQLGPHDENDGHVSSVRIALDAAPARALAKLAQTLSQKEKK